MPVYNGEATVLASLNSILNQTYKNIEIIVVDDKSTDSTLSILKSVNDSRVRIISHPNRSTVGAIRSFGVKFAKGDYIAVQDADDISFPKRLEMQLEYMRKKSLKLCGTWAYLVKSDGSRYEFCHPVEYEDIKRNIIRTNCFIHTTVMFAKDAYEAVGGYNSSVQLNYVEDYDLLLRIVAKYPAGNIPKILAEYTAPKDSFKYIWREQSHTAYARFRAIFNYGYSWSNLFFVCSPLFVAFIPKKIKLWFRKLLFKKKS